MAGLTLGADPGQRCRDGCGPGRTTVDALIGESRQGPQHRCLAGRTTSPEGALTVLEDVVTTGVLPKAVHQLREAGFVVNRVITPWTAKRVAQSHGCCRP